MTIDELLEKYRAENISEREKGAKFEQLMKNFLPIIYSGDVKNIMLWSNFSNEQDLGIDLVIETFSSEIWAVQCKFYAETTTIDKADVDSFISNSGREFNGKKFSRRIFISTSDNFTANALKMFENQTPPIIQIGMDELRKAAVDWEKVSRGEKIKILRDLRDYQQTALDNAVEHFKTNERGQLIMACGTGKTFTSLKIAEKLTDNSGLVLFLVPSLSLLSQSLREWANFADKPINAVCVCSDKTVTSNDDIQNINLPVPVTNQPEEISAAVNRTGNFGMTVIFSTYHSLDKVIAAHLNFDLVICDEAHRTAGNLNQDKTARIFSMVHSNENIQAKRRIYMTATPKMYSSEAKKTADDSQLTVWSMDNEEIFGAEFYKISFAQAIELGCLSDYKVLVLTVHERALPPALREYVYSKSNEVHLDDALKIVGCIKALSKNMNVNSKPLMEDDADFMHTAVAFCPKIAYSKNLTKHYAEIQEKFFQDMPLEIRRKCVQIQMTHVDGSMNAEERRPIIDALKNVADENKCQIVSNVRCLSEGVDVPSLDAVIFLSPKKSGVDIVQAIGRALRISKNKKFGYIIIPVIIPMNTSPEEALNSSDFKEVWQILNAMRSHDENLDIVIQQIRANGKSDKIAVDGGEKSGGGGEGDVLQLSFEFEDWTYKIYARMVEKVGDRLYWQHWAIKVSVIVERHTERILELISKSGEPQKAFQNFLRDLQKIINPSITQTDAVDMLAQHLITRPVFEALFENYSFAQNNPVSKSMTEILRQLDKDGLSKERDQLNDFYENVKIRCRDMGDAANRQKIITDLYDNFFKMALPMTAQKLGIVYTPVEVVDFIIQSVNDVLRENFGKTFNDENVHILDPFTGTGTFITRLIQSGLIDKDNLLRKYQREIHANEIVLLAYYIAAINIENAFHDVANLDGYETFNGICLADTFQSYENAANPEIYLSGYENPLRENSTLIKKQIDTKIEIIIGNPPYSVGQKSANDNAQNVHYEKLERRIAETYAAGTNATNKNALYDSYIKAFRWASDRISEGVIGFVTNAGFLDGAAMDGLRKIFSEEFSEIYIFNLRGNQRTQGEISRKEGGKIFGSGSRAPVAITILVKNKNHTGTAKIFYKDIGDYLTREEKLLKISATKTVLSGDFQEIIPNEKFDWINQRGNEFEKYILLGDKKNNSAEVFFEIYSPGLKTNRDVWCYNFSKKILAENMQTTINFYNEHSPENFNQQKIVWTRETKQNKNRGIKYIFDEKKIISASYRPFCKENLYYDKNLNEVIGTIGKFFPTNFEENLIICVSTGERNFSVFLTKKICDVQFQFNGQCFPLYWYSDTPEIPLPGFEKYANKYYQHDGVTDFVLKRAQFMYGEAVTKEDIFYYVYGFLHLPSYREKFSAELKKSLPRIFLVNESYKFWALSRAGRALAEIHLNYERQEATTGVEVLGAECGDFRVKKMRFNKARTEIIYNDKIKIVGIPARANEYVVNGRSPLEWIVERYQIKIDKASGIENDPNDWCAEHDSPRYILDLIMSCITVSLKTLEIVDALPEINFD